MKAVIAGAGIAGLSAAIALAQRGWEVEVLEQAPALTEIGAGLQISPNGWRVLEALGVADRLAGTLFEPETIEMRMGRSGRTVFALPMRGYAQARWGGRYIHIHRADLVEALVRRLEALIPGAIHTDMPIAGYDAEGAARLSQGGSIEADLVIGADGLHSMIRTQMLGPDQPRYTGNVAWRTVVPVDVLGDHAPPPAAVVWVGDKRHAETTRLRAGTLANFVGMYETPEPAPESWRATGERSEAQALFEGWSPVIAAILDHAPVLHRWALFDRAPLPRWSDGAATLIGDAAHPMVPSMAQGAVQALEDAWILARAVTEAGVKDGLAQYLKARIARTARVQKASAQNARIFHQASGLGALVVYGPMAVGARILPELIHRRQDWVYRFDATA